MRRAIVLTLIMFGITAQGEALDAYPTTSLAEDATATWCPYCPEAYAGLDVVQSQYDATEFLSVRYYATPNLPLGWKGTRLDDDLTGEVAVGRASISNVSNSRILCLSTILPPFCYSYRFPLFYHI